MENEKEKFLAYEKVRMEGKYNMLSVDAMKATGLTKPDYIYIIEHYSELHDKYINEINGIEQELLSSMKNN